MGVDELVAVEIADPAPPEEGPGAARGPALSPSRAADFMTCPLLYRFRVIDKLPEPPSAAAARGTLVHAVLERLFDLAATERTLDAARSLLQPEWDRLAAAEPDLAALFPGETELDAWIRDAAIVVDRYFSWRIRAAWSPRTANCTSRRSWSPGSGSAATSTGSTSRPPGRSGSSTTRPARRRRRTSRPGRCSR